MQPKLPEGMTQEQFDLIEKMMDRLCNRGIEKWLSQWNVCARFKPGTLTDDQFGECLRTATVGSLALALGSSNALVMAHQPFSEEEMQKGMMALSQQIGEESIRVFKLVLSKHKPH